MALQMKLYSSSVTSLNLLVRLQSCEKAMGWYTAQCKVLLFCVKISRKESSNFELAHLKKKKKKKKRRRKKENILSIWRLSGLVLLRCFFTPLGVLFIV